MSNSDHNKKITDKEVSEFLYKVKTGQIKPDPKKCGHFYDENGPGTSFSFPDIGWEIHVHWKDEEREDISKAHVKDMKTGKYLPDISSTIESQTIAMLKYFSGLDEKDKKVMNNKELEEKEKEKKKLEREEEKYKNVTHGFAGIILLVAVLGLFEGLEFLLILNFLPIILTIIFGSKWKRAEKKLQKVKKELEESQKENS